MKLGLGSTKLHRTRGNVTRHTSRKVTPPANPVCSGVVLKSRNCFEKLPREPRSNSANTGRVWQQIRQHRPKVAPEVGPSLAQCWPILIEFGQIPPRPSVGWVRRNIRPHWAGLHHIWFGIDKAWDKLALALTKIGVSIKLAQVLTEIWPGSEIGAGLPNCGLHETNLGLGSNEFGQVGVSSHHTSVAVFAQCGLVSGNFEPRTGPATPPCWLSGRRLRRESAHPAWRAKRTPNLTYMAMGGGLESGATRGPEQRCEGGSNTRFDKSGPPVLTALGCGVLRGYKSQTPKACKTSSSCFPSEVDAKSVTGRLRLASGSTWGSISGPARGPSRVDLGSIWGSIRVELGSVQGRHRTYLGSSWGRVGVGSASFGVGSFRVRLGVDSGWQWDRVCADPVSIRARYGVALGIEVGSCLGRRDSGFESLRKCRNIEH